MSRLPVPNLESDTGPSGQVYAQIKKAIGSVPKTFAAMPTALPPSNRFSPPMRFSQEAG
jgi:hypothetical protein